MAQPASAFVCPLPGRIGSDGVADADVAVTQHVGAQTAPVNERSQRAVHRQALQVGARLAQAPADTPDSSDGEAPAHQRVEVDAARDDPRPARAVAC